MSETDVEILLPKLFLSHSVSYMKKKCHEIIFFSFAIVFPRVKPNKRQTHFLGAKKSFLQNNFFLQIEVKTLCVCVCVLQRPL